MTLSPLERARMVAEGLKQLIAMKHAETPAPPKSLLKEAA